MHYLRCIDVYYKHGKRVFVILVKYLLISQPLSSPVFSLGFFKFFLPKFCGYFLFPKHFFLLGFYLIVNCGKIRIT